MKTGRKPLERGPLMTSNVLPQVRYQTFLIRYGADIKLLHKSLFSIRFWKPPFTTQHKPIGSSILTSFVFSSFHSFSFNSVPKGVSRNSQKLDFTRALYTSVYTRWKIWTSTMPKTLLLLCKRKWSRICGNTSRYHWRKTQMSHWRWSFLSFYSLKLHCGITSDKINRLFLLLTRRDINEWTAHHSLAMGQFRNTVYVFLR